MGKIFLLLTIVCSITCVEMCPTLCRCYSNMGIQSVDCARRNLTEIPSNIPSNVQVLDLSNNLIHNITGAIEHNLTDLEQLDLSYNDLQSLHQGVFRNLHHLQKLNLSYNSISTCDGPVFHNMTRVSDLDLSWNNLTKIKAEFLDGASDLAELILSNNPIQEIHQDIFSKLTALRSLDLTNTSYWTWKDHKFQYLENLRDLNFQYNNLTDVSSVASSFPSTISLRSLQLAFNNIENLTAYSFHHWPSLEELDLSHNLISSLNVHTFEGLSQLRVLKLDDNLLVFVTLPVFSPMVSLRSLSLSDMGEMLYLGKQSFQGLKNLTYLYLSRNEKLRFVHEEIFHDLEKMKFLNLSHNNISHLSESTFPMKPDLTVDISGGKLQCDCHLDWLVHELNSASAQKGTQFMNVENILCVHLNKSVLPLQSLNNVSLQCQSTPVSTAQIEIKIALGSPARIVCPYSTYPPPTITWITPHKQNLTINLAHPIDFLDHPSLEDIEENGPYHIGHYWHSSSAYYPELEHRKDRIVILRDGSLYIDYFLRTDTGPYKCITDNVQNTSTVLFLLWVDNAILMEVKVMSLLVGFGCAASFFMLNLIHVFIMALARRCINQRRREAIAQFVDNFEKYRTAKLGSLKDNYNAQMARIRDTYRNRMDKLSDSYTNQMMRIREGASQIKEGTSHRVDIIRDKYHNQQKKIRDYSSHQMNQLREAYNNQILRIRDYGSAQLAKIHKKYKLKQKHMMKMFETMNIENCRTMVDVECVRTESELFENEGILIPEESQSVSSEEYLTATSNTSSHHNSRQNLQEPTLEGINEVGTVVLPPDTLLGERETPVCHISEKNVNEGEDPLFATQQSATLMSEFELQNFIYIDGMDTLEVKIEDDEVQEGRTAESNHLNVKNEDDVAPEAKNENCYALRVNNCDENKESKERETFV